MRHHVSKRTDSQRLAILFLTVKLLLKRDLSNKSPSPPQRTSQSTEDFVWNNGRCLRPWWRHQLTKLTSPRKSPPPGLLLDEIITDQILLKFLLLATGTALLNILKFLSKFLMLTNLETNFFRLTFNSFFRHNSVPSSSVILADTKRCYCFLQFPS